MVAQNPSRALLWLDRLCVGGSIDIRTTAIMDRFNSQRKGFDTKFRRSLQVTRRALAGSLRPRAHGKGSANNYRSRAKGSRNQPVIAATLDSGRNTTGLEASLRLWHFVLFIRRGSLVFGSEKLTGGDKKANRQ